MAHLLELIYLIGSVTFMVGLKMLSKPDTARRGNLIAAFGMGIAILGTIFLYKTAEGGNLGNLIWIFAALVVGAIIGVTMAKRVQMTAMPQMVSFFNGMGGACAALISIIEFQHVVHMGSAPTANHMLIILAGLIIGSVSFSGSVVAYGKLEGKIDDFNIKGQQFLNVGLVLGIIVLAALVIMGTLNGIPWFYIVLALSILYGLIFV